jgi:hypothetical protein
MCVIAKNQSTENPTKLNMEATDGDKNELPIWCRISYYQQQSTNKKKLEHIAQPK